jgi:hypothetical protein
VEQAYQEGAEIQWGVSKTLALSKFYPASTKPMNRSTMFVAITNKGQIRFMLKRDGTSGDQCLQFLSQLIAENGRKVILLVKSIRGSDQENATEWLNENASRIAVINLPSFR